MGPGRRAWVTRAPFTALVSPGPLRGCNEQAQGKSSMRKNSKNLEEAGLAGLYVHWSSATPRNRCFFFFFFANVNFLKYSSRLGGSSTRFVF